MTTEILDLIKQIKTKFIEQNDKVLFELSKNNELAQKIVELTTAKEEKEKQQALLTAEICKLREEISSLKEKETKSTSVNEKDAEIDLLVREIEHCINQLKSN